MAPSFAPPLSAEPRAAARRVFGDRLPLAERYADLLCSTGVDHGLVGPREVERIWDRHVLNCAVLAELVPEGARVADVGSGAGLPGLAVAVARPDLHVVLVEPLQRRCTWLDAAVAELGIATVTVLRARAEEVGDTFDAVTSRAVAALPKLARWCLPLTRAGGSMLAIKGRSAADELAESQPVLRRLGAASSRVVRAGVDVVAEPTTVVEVVAGRSRR